MRIITSRGTGIVHRAEGFLSSNRVRFDPLKQFHIERALRFL